MQSYMTGMQSYMATVWKCRYFWMLLVKMDLRTRYRRSMLGVGWSLLHPIAMTAVLCTVFSSMWDMQIRDFGPYLMTGLVFWSFMTTVVITGCQTFYAAETYIRQYPAPLAIYPLRTMLGAAFHFALGLAVAIGLTWIMSGFTNPWTMLRLPLALVMLSILGWSLAILAGFANVYFSDMQHLMEIILQMLFYLTPIMYPQEMLRERGAGWIIDYNPIAALLALIREPILEGNPLLEGAPPLLTSFQTAGCTTLVVASLAVLVLVRLQRKLIFQL